MAQDHDEVTEERGLPDVEKLRRFSLGIGVALLIYVVAGGEIGKSLQTAFIPIVSFERPGYLLGALILASVYSSSRYWYYGINLLQTRRKIRKYLRKERSVHVFGGDEVYLKEQLDTLSAQRTEARSSLGALHSKLPPGLPRSEVLTYGVTDLELIKEHVAKKLNKYFPGLKAENISIGAPHNTNNWAHVSTTSRATNWGCWLEDFELWLPITVNVIALLSLSLCAAWPWVKLLFER